MVPQGPSGGAQSVPPSLLRSNSGLLGGQAGGMPSQNSFSMLVSPRSQFNNMSMLGNGSNVPSLLHQSYGNGSSQRGINDVGAESNPLSSVGNGMGFNAPSSSYISSPVTAAGNSSGQAQQLLNPSGNQVLMEQQQIDQHNFQHNQRQMQQQYSAPNGSQQQFQSMRPALAGAGPVKLEPRSSNENSHQQLQALRNLPSVKLEPQQLQNMRNLGPVKMEPQHSDPSLFLQQQQQQQQQQQLLLSRQSPQAAAAAQMFHQQRLLQIQQQQFLKGMPQQRSPLQQQFQTQSLPVRSPVKPVYEPGMCARRLTHYMYQQQHRPEDNNIEFWRKFVAEYFAPNAKKKWCVSMYPSGRQTNGVFPQDVWHCEICNRKPGRGFEATVEVLPRLFKIKYESGTIEELLYVDMPREYQNASGQIVLDYAKAIQESVFEQLRVVRDGQLRIVFSPDLKICSWEFCAWRHDELIPKRLLTPQVSQLQAAAQKFQAATQNASSGSSVSDQQNNCNLFVASAHQLDKALEVPLVNDLGYTKRYIRCLQISEVVNSMKDLIDYSRETGAGPVESLAKYPRRMNPSSVFQGQVQLPSEDHQQQLQTGIQNSSNDNRVLPSTTGAQTVNKNMNQGSASSSNIPGLIHQNSMNSRQQNPHSSSSYGGVNGVQMSSSPGSSSNLRQTQPSSSPFQSPTPSSSNTVQPGPNISIPGGASSNVTAAHSPNISMQQSGDADAANDTKSSVQKIIHDMMMSSSQLGGSGMMANANGIMPNNSVPAINGGNTGCGNMGNGLGNSAMVNGIRAALGNNPVSMARNGRMGMAMARDPSMNPQQQDMSNQLQMLNGLGAMNGFNNLHFDWKTMP